MAPAPWDYNVSWDWEATAPPGCFYTSSAEPWSGPAGIVYKALWKWMKFTLAGSDGGQINLKTRLLYWRLLKRSNKRSAAFGSCGSRINLRRYYATGFPSWSRLAHGSEPTIHTVIASSTRSATNTCPFRATPRRQREYSSSGQPSGISTQT